MRQKAFTLIEVVIILVIVGLLAAFVLVKYLNLLPQATRATELSTVGTIRTGISLYGAESSTKSRTPRFPAVLDSAADGGYFSEQPFFYHRSFSTRQK